MKRPLFTVGFTYLLTLLCALLLPGTFAVVLLFLAFITVLKMLLGGRRSGTVLTLCVTVCIALGSLFAVTTAQYLPVMRLSDKEAEVTVTLLEPPTRSNGRVYYVVQVRDTGIVGAPKNFKLRLSSSQPIEAEPYDEVTAQVHFMTPPRSKGFDALAHYRAKDIYLYGYVTDFATASRTTEQKPLMYHVLSVRTALKNKIMQVFPGDEGALMTGMLLGDRSELDRSIQNDFRSAGVSHMLALSGMHFAVLLGMLSRFLSFLRLNRRASVPFLMLFALFYMALAGFTPSIVRSGIMVLIIQASYLFKRRPDPRTSLGFAVLLMCLVSPYCATDVGFLLSVSATLGIQVLGPRLSEKIDTAARGYVPGWITESIAISLAATIFTLPVQILCFGEISALTLLVNVVLSLPGTWLLIGSFVFALLSFVPYTAFLQYPVGIVSALMGKLMLLVTKWVSELPFAVVNTSQDFVKLWLFGTVLIFALAYALGRKKAPYRLAALLSVVLLLAGVFSAQLSEHGAIEVAVLDVGDGLSVAVTERNHAAVIVCGGNKLCSRDALYYLKGQGADTLDLMVLPALDAGSAAGASGVLERHPAQAILMPESGAMRSRVEHNLPGWAVKYTFTDNQVRFWNEVTLRTRQAGEGQAVYMTIRGISFLILNGQTDASELSADWCSPDVLIFSEPPLSLSDIKAQYVFYSAGEERLQETLSSIDQGEGALYATGGEGALVMTCYDSRAVRLRREE